MEGTIGTPRNPYLDKLIEKRDAKKPLSGADALNMAKGVNITINNETPKPRTETRGRIGRVGGRLDAYPTYETNQFQKQFEKPKYTDKERDEQWDTDFREALGEGPIREQKSSDMMKWEEIEEEAETGPVGDDYEQWYLNAEEEQQEIQRPENLGERVMEESDLTGAAWHDILIDMYAKQNPFISRSKIAKAVLDVANRHYENFMRTGQDKSQYRNWVSRGLKGGGKYSRDGGSKRSYVKKLGDNPEVSRLLGTVQEVQHYIKGVQDTVRKKKTDETAGQHVGGSYVQAAAEAGDVIDDGEIRKLADRKAASLMRTDLGFEKMEDRQKDSWGLLTDRLKKAIEKDVMQNRSDPDVERGVQAHGSVDGYVTHILVNVMKAHTPRSSWTGRIKSNRY